MSEEAKPRWFVPTPAKLIALLLAVELCLLLINRHSGWMCVAGIVTLLVTLLALLVWFVCSYLWPREGWSHFQFGIRTLLLLMVCFAVVGGWFSWKMRYARWQSEVVRTLGDRIRPKSIWAPTHFSRQLLGTYFFLNIEEIWIRGEFSPDMVNDLNKIATVKTVHVAVQIDPLSESEAERLQELRHVKKLYVSPSYETPYREWLRQGRVDMALYKQYRAKEKQIRSDFEQFLRQLQSAMPNTDIYVHAPPTIYEFD